MIHIMKPYITQDGDRAYLKAHIDISEDAVDKYVTAGYQPIIIKPHKYLI